MQKIITFLWFDTQAEEAAHYYVSLFKNSRIIATTPLVIKFDLDGQEFCALKGGPAYKFTPAISLLITCEDQAEVDHFWDAFSKDGGTPNRCGWIADKYGVSWQVVPKVLPELINDPDKEKSERVTQAMLKMQKLDIAELKKAHAGN